MPHETFEDVPVTELATTEDPETEPVIEPTEPDPDDGDEDQDA
jgi:hypothetical protein